MAVGVSVGLVRCLLALDGIQGGGNDFFIQRDPDIFPRLVHGEQDGRGAECGGDACGFLRCDTVVNVQVSPAAVDVLVTVDQVDLSLCQGFVESFLFGIRFALPEASEGTQAVGMTPDVVGRGLVWTTELREVLHRPGGCLFDGGNGFRALVSGIEESG